MLAGFARRVGWAGSNRRMATTRPLAPVTRMPGVIVGAGMGVGMNWRTVMPRSYFCWAVTVGVPWIVPTTWRALRTRFFRAIRLAKIVEPPRVPGSVAAARAVAYAAW